MTILLIGGPSHAGKSTLSAHLAKRLGWTFRSTDTLARHPGRPWPVGDAPVKPHVAEHYLTLTPAELIASVMAHYRGTVWPLAKAVISEAAGAGEGLVLEGSALWPADVAGLDLPDIKALWLTADPDLVRRRILAESAHATADAAGRRMIESFLQRAIDFDALVRADAARLGLPVLRVGADVGVLGAQCLALLGLLERGGSDPKL